MRTILLAAAVTAALVIPVLAYREPPVPLATLEPPETADPALVVARECNPTVQHLEDGWSLVRLCSREGD